jgi:hypothetical protein
MSYVVQQRLPRACCCAQVADVEAHLSELKDRVVDFCMAVCVANISLIIQAQSVDLNTGETREINAYVINWLYM